MWSIYFIFELVYENKVQSILFVLFLGLFQHLLSSYVSRKRLPPGPTGLPFVGYIPFLGRAAHKQIAELSRKYGNVFTSVFV